MARGARAQGTGRARWGKRGGRVVRGSGAGPRATGRSLTRPIIVRVDAQAELEEAASWYESRRPGLGVEFVTAIEVALDAIAEAPESWPRWQAGYPYRKYVLRRFPFVVFFTAEGAGIQIVAFAHAKRRPGYWMRPSSQ
ncbi:type II toxin-antitoxin system RelE/ParE family toxin [Sorangium sp. So ce381]|uniref:type II toxin-antitoxin system RelE/ParE family toxin n=1 Tax=Sorangium sp. So ce381 TaxID=3133307 RepID=UPI003F5AE001